MRLTDITIRALKAPATGVVLYSDDVLTGFGIRVSQGGTKSFVLTHGPRRTRETLGRVGVVSLADAREEAKKRLAEYTLGREKPRAISWANAKEEYFREQIGSIRETTATDYLYILDRHFRFGDLKLLELAPHDILKSLSKLADRPATQQRAFVVLRTFLSWVYRKHYTERHLMERMKAPHPYVPRERVLSNEELARVWQASGGDTFGRIVKLLILTGQRRGEITRLTSSMIGADKISLPGWLVKNGRDHAFPLGPMAKAIIGPVPGEDIYLFPGRLIKTPFDGFSKCKPKLEARADSYDWTLHDLRRTFATGLASLGVSIPVVERLLNHVSGSFGGIVGVYQRHDFMPEMREAIRMWEEHVLALTR
ncbi:MAG: integrase arm-type DNA-binding domain-containing protein [Rhizomicrobium sp.]